jgi:glycosyltransferase involved in cell wall biosynthesis
VELQLEVKDRDSLNVLFLSRIDPMKNLNYALDTLGKIDQKNINFNIYGPIRVPEYWEMCKKNIARLPSNIVVNYQGALKHNEVFEIFAKNDLFFLPSAGENYGHAIFEAMLAGVPVLISDRTPWRNLEKEGVGWDFNLNQIESFIEAIKKVYLMKPEEHYKWREKIRNWALIKQTNEKDIENNRQLFKYAIQKFKKG